MKFANKKSIVELLNTLFRDVDISAMDMKKSKKIIIERVFNRGNIEEIKMILQYYGK